MNLRVSRRLKEELSWAKDKWLQLIINTMFSYTRKNLKNKINSVIMVTVDQVAMCKR